MLFSKKENAEQIPQPENTKGTLGSRISELRKNKGLTQEEFAEKLGVTAQAVSKWENDVSCPDIMLLPKIAELFSVSIDELMGVKPRENAILQKSEPNQAGKNLRIHILNPKKDSKPVNIAIPIPFVTRVTGAGLKISGILGDKALNDSTVEQILEQVKSGAVGEILDLTAEDGTRINIEVS